MGMSGLQWFISEDHQHSKSMQEIFFRKAVVMLMPGPLVLGEFIP